MEHTRELHIISGELNILKRTLHPLYNMINALQDRHRSKRAGYFYQTSEADRHATMPDSTVDDFSEKQITQISPEAKVYLADVADHVLILTEEIDILRGTVENMINMVDPHVLSR
jgi:Mg2+ and Co2+ transporter CorA